MRKIFIIIVVLLLPINTSAFTVKGYGGMDCGKLLDHFDDKFHREHYLSWFEGYLSARNWFGNLEKGKGIDDSSFGYAMKNYCEKNPLKKVFHAAHHLYENELE